MTPLRRRLSPDQAQPGAAILTRTTGSGPQGTTAGVIVPFRQRRVRQTPRRKAATEALDRVRGVIADWDAGQLALDEAICSVHSIVNGPVGDFCRHGAIE